MTAAAGDLCTVADVQAFLSLGAGQDTALLQSLITSASAFIDSYCNRNLVKADYTERRNGQGNSKIKLKEWPINSVTSVTIDDVAIPLSTKVSMDGYVFDDKWVYLRGDCNSFTPGALNVVIMYNAGYDQSAIPAELKQACVEIVSAKYKRRLDLHVSSKVLDGQQITFSMKDVPPSTQTTLKNYSAVYYGQ